MTENDMVGRLMTYLKASPILMDRLGTYTNNGNAYPMLVYSPILPSKWPVKDSSINIYPVASTTLDEYDTGFFSASCRAASFTDSRGIAAIVRDVLNRRSETGFSVVVTILSTIVPTNGDSDNYNTPVEITVRAV